MRNQQLDGLRGFAIVLMILDHVLVTGLLHWGWPEQLQWLRLTVTRLALPLFMMIAGYLWADRGPSWRRLPWLIAAAFVATVCCRLLGLPPIEIVALYLGCMVVSKYVVLAPIPTMIVGLLWAFNFPDTFPQLFYHPGYVLTWLALGVIWWRQELAWDYEPETIQTPPGAQLYGWLGRWPLTSYVFHLIVLALLVRAI